MSTDSYSDIDPNRLANFFEDSQPQPADQPGPSSSGLTPVREKSPAVDPQTLKQGRGRVRTAKQPRHLVLSEATVASASADDPSPSPSPEVESGDQDVPQQPVPAAVTTGNQGPSRKPVASTRRLQPAVVEKKPATRTRVVKAVPKDNAGPSAEPTDDGLRKLTRAVRGLSSRYRPAADLEEDADETDAPSVPTRKVSRRKGKDVLPAVSRVPKVEGSSQVTVSPVILSYLCENDVTEIFGLRNEGERWGEFLLSGTEFERYR